MRLLPAIAVVLLTGCGHTREIRLSPQMNNAPFTQVNLDAANRTVHLELQDGRSFDAQGLNMSADSTTWTVGDLEAAWNVTTSEVRKISFLNRVRGAGDGLTLGALIFLPMAILSSSLNSGEGVDRTTQVLNAIGAAGLWGGGIGAMKGSRITYVFIAPRALQARAARP